MPRALSVRWGWLLITFWLTMICGSASSLPARDADPHQLHAVPVFTPEPNGRAGGAPVYSLALNTTPAGQIQSFIRTWPSPMDAQAVLAVRYQHAMVQLLKYGPGHAGPDGILFLPQGQKFQSVLTFSYSTIKKEHPFQPGRKSPELTLAIAPGILKEDWQFAGHVQVRRSYYQAVAIPAVVVRFKAVNHGRHKLSGFRLNANFIQPCLLGNVEKASPDAFWENDFRSSAVYFHRLVQGGETWLALAWAPGGGKVTTDAGPGNLGENGGARSVSLNNLALETPAIDLEPQQPMVFEFIQTWGLDRKSVMEQVARLRVTSGYSAWKAKQAAVASNGTAMVTTDPYINYFFRILKHWAPWQIKRQGRQSLIFATMADNRGASPEKVAAGLRGLLALGYFREVKNYLNQWLDERQESVEVVYLVHMIYDYLAYSGDLDWLRENAFRIQDLMTYIDSLDDDHDGLPNFRITLNPQGAVKPDEPVYHARETDLQLCQYSMASILAYRYLGELFSLLNRPRLTRALNKKVQKASTVLVENYWNSRLGREGFYAFGRLEDRDVMLDIRHISAINAYLDNIGPRARQEIVFRDCWINPEWREEQGFYRSFLKDQPASNDILPINANSYDCGFTHRVLLAGLTTPTIAPEAWQQLKSYTKKIITDPELCGLPGNSAMPAGGLSFSSYSYIPLLLRGLGGLEIAPRGIMISRPLVDQALHIAHLPVQHKRLTLDIAPRLGKAVRLTVNGHPVAFETWIDLKAYQTKSITIKVERKISKNHKKKRKSKRKHRRRKIKSK